VVAIGAEGDFERFFRGAEPRLRRAFVGSHGVEGAADATAEALAWAWEHWEEIPTFDNPLGYLYRVGQSRTRARRTPDLPSPEAVGLPDVEPQLLPALAALSPQQRTAVWLVHACGWRPVDAAVAMAISASAVATHAGRGLDRLREMLEVTEHA
jgi:DNA-directed RNA polymerase specialized sigma24 family protein